MSSVCAFPAACEMVTARLSLSCPVGLSCGLSLVIVWLSNRCRKRAGSCVILDACVVVANTASYMAFLYVLRASNVCPAPSWQAWVGPSSVCARLGVACSNPEAVKLCAYGSQLLSRVTVRCGGRVCEGGRGS